MSISEEHQGQARSIAPEARRSGVPTVQSAQIQSHNPAGRAIVRIGGGFTKSLIAQGQMAGADEYVITEVRKSSRIAESPSAMQTYSSGTVLKNQTGRFSSRDQQRASKGESMDIGTGEIVRLDSVGDAHRLATQTQVDALYERVEGISQQLTQIMAMLTDQKVAVVAREPDSRLDSQDVRVRLLDAEGGSYSAQETARRIGVTRQTIYNWHKKADIVGVAYRDRKLRFPAWQFEDSDLLQGLPEVLKVLDGNGAWSQLAFMLNRNPRLDGARPLDLLRAGEVEMVVEAARLYGEHEPT